MEDTIEETTNWSIKLSSNCNTNLNLCEILEVLNCFEVEEYQSLKSDMAVSMNEYIGNNSIAKWQVEKGNEMEVKWHENLLHKTKDGKLTVSTSFQTKLPESFELGDVIEWTEGFNRLGKIWPMVVMKTKLKNGNCDSDLWKKQTNLIDKLINNQNFEINKVKH